MGFVGFNGKGWIVDKNGEAVYIVGINYVASYVCTNFLEDFRPDVIEKDLADIEAMGLNAVRMPIYWGYAEPEQGVFNPKLFEHFDQFIAMAKTHNLYVMPWMLVGVATKLVDVPYRQGRPFFEGDMLFAAENHLRTFARRYKDEEQILFWDICDEPEGYASNYSRWPGTDPLPFNTSKFNHWLRHMYEAFKQEDPNHLVTLGFGDIATLNYGYTMLDSAEILDVMSVTCYPFDSSVEGLDTARNNYLLGFCVKMNSQKGKPVFTCEAPGMSDVWYSKERIGRFFKVSMYSNLVNGSTGILPWAYNDFSEEIWETGCLNKSMSETSFGIVDRKGNLKPAGLELKDFAGYIKKIQITDYERVKPKVAIFIPCGYYGNILHTKRRVRAAYQFAKGCGADVEFVWGDRELSEFELVIFVGSMTRNTEWRKLVAYVEQGGNLLFDYSGVVTMSPYSNEFFGAEVDTRQQNFDFDRIIMKDDMGELTVGQELTFTMGPRTEPHGIGTGMPLQRAISICDEYLIVKPTKAEVKATFADGTPALLKNPYGKGTVWMFTGQFHAGMFEIRYSEYQNHMMFSLYDAILKESKIARPCTYINAELETGLFTKDNGDKLLLLINHGPEKNDVKLQLEAELASMHMTVWDGRENVSLEGDQMGLVMEGAEVVTLLFT